MELHRCLICLGSNTSSGEKLELARTELSAFFPGIIFGKEMETSPLYFTLNKNLFLNQLCFFRSSYGMAEIEAVCKKIEKKAGRKPEDKLSETVKLDIDLLRMDEQIIRPEEMKRSYIRRGMKELLPYFE